MATYKYPDFIRQTYNYVFDIAAGAGSVAQNQHKSGQGDIRWRLIVATA